MNLAYPVSSHRAGWSTFGVTLLCLTFLWLTAATGADAQSPHAPAECQPTIVVQNASNDGPGSLRAAMDALCDGGVITFGSSMTVLLSEELAPPVSMTLDGGDRPVTISGNQAVRVLMVNNGITLTITQLTIAEGFSPRGAGISVAPQAMLDFNRSLLLANRCDGNGQGCGLQNDGIATIRNSTVSNNSGFQGGGIQNDGTATIVNTTLSNNSAASGASLVNYGTLTLLNSILANGNNSQECTGPGTFAANRNNLIEDGSCNEGAINLRTGDPGLSGLGDFGGPTLTHALAADSLARNAADPVVCTQSLVNNLDQRGAPRPGTGTAQCDMGAYELQENEPSRLLYLPALHR